MTLCPPTVLKEWWIPKLKRFCIRKFLCFHVRPPPKIVLKDYPGRFNAKMLSSAVPVRGDCWWTRERRNLKFNSEPMVFHMQQSSKKTSEYEKSEGQCIKSKITRTKMHQSVICRHIARTIPSVEKQGRWFAIRGTLSTSSCVKFRPIPKFCTVQSIGQKASSTAHVRFVWCPQRSQNRLTKDKFDTLSIGYFAFFLRDRHMVLAVGAARVSPSEGLRKL